MNLDGLYTNSTIRLGHAQILAVPCFFNGICGCSTELLDLINIGEYLGYSAESSQGERYLCYSA